MLSTRCQKWLCMVVILCSSGAGAASGTLLDGDADVLYVLGAQLVRDFSTGAIVPAVPGEARASAAALLSNRSSARGPQRAVAPGLALVAGRHRALPPWRARRVVPAAALARLRHPPADNYEPGARCVPSIRVCLSGPLWLL